MQSKIRLWYLAVFFISIFNNSCSQPIKQSSPEQESFIEEMVINHHFDRIYLEQVLTDAEIKEDILRKIQKPAEAMPWYNYRKIFLTDARIQEGVEFWRNHAEILASVEQRYGVPPQIITAILGVETFYGKKTGQNRIIDALSTLAFAYPPRSAFFRKELENFLILCRQESIEPAKPLGSYAGAMGMPQFMPSSYLTYAEDYDGDGRRDIWHNPADVIASVANYLSRHGWQPNQAIAYSASANGTDYKMLLENGSLKPDLSFTELKSRKVSILGSISTDQKVKLLAFEQEHGDELWAVLNNFYVITRYNHSPLYAMAVFQLSESILKSRPPSPYE